MEGKKISFDGLSFDVIQWMPFTPWRTPFIGWSPTFADPTLANCATNSNRRHPDDICSNTFATSILSVNQKFLFKISDFVFWKHIKQTIGHRSTGSAGAVQQGRRRLRQLQFLSISTSRQQIRLRAHRWLERFVSSVFFYFLFCWVAWSFIAGSCERERRSCLHPVVQTLSPSPLLLYSTTLFFHLMIGWSLIWVCWHGQIAPEGRFQGPSVATLVLTATYETFRWNHKKQKTNIYRVSVFYIYWYDDSIWVKYYFMGSWVVE